jgi:F420-dependent oxidoreductase-like protein
MRIGIFGGDLSSLDKAVASVKTAADQGFPSFWVPQIFGLDALTTIAVAGREVGGIEFGTAVVPTYPRHPTALAGQAATAQMATGGRLTLGIGLSHQFVIEQMFGYSFEKPVRHMKEYLTVLLPLLRGEQVQFKGESLSTNAQLSPVASPPPSVMVAALGEQMLKLAGTLTDGTITWMTGPATIAAHTAPTLRAAADAAGRPEPRIAVGLPVCVCDDPAAARERAANTFAIYGQLPSYRAMLDREGAAGPADVAIVGSEDEVRAGIERVAESGCTDFVASEFGATDEERTRTRDLLRSLL